MLKDFFKNMFADDDDYEEEELVEEEEEEVPAALPAYQPPAAAPAAAEGPLYVEPEIQKQPKRSYIFDITEQTAVKPDESKTDRKSTFDGLELDGYEPQKKTSGTYHFDRKKLPKARVNHQNDAPGYQAILSPIFGNIDEKSKEFDKVHNAIDLPKPQPDVVMVQVISPMYGNNLPGSKPVESIPAYKPSGKGSRPRKQAAPRESADLSDMLAKPENKNARQEALPDEKGSK